MKKTFSLFLAVVCVFTMVMSLSACKKKEYTETVVEQIVTDDNGNAVTDAEGNTVTELVKVTSQISNDNNTASNKDNNDVGTTSSKNEASSSGENSNSNSNGDATSEGASSSNSTTAKNDTTTVASTSGNATTVSTTAKENSSSSKNSTTTATTTTKNSDTNSTTSTTTSTTTEATTAKPKKRQVTVTVKLPYYNDEVHDLTVYYRLADDKKYTNLDPQEVTLNGSEVTVKLGKLKGEVKVLVKISGMSNITQNTAVIKADENSVKITPVTGIEVLDGGMD